MEIDAPLILARWAHFASLMIVFGGSLFHVYAPASPSLRQAMLPALASADRFVSFAAWMAFASALAWVARIVVAIGGSLGSTFDPTTLSVFFFDTSFGPAWIIRLILLLAIAVLAGLPSAHRSSVSRAAFLACLAGCALVSGAWVSHAATATGAALAVQVTSYGLHLLAAGAWIGGLVPLGYTLVGRAQDGKYTAARRLVLVRFSNLGTIAVALVAASGIANSAFRLRAARDLVTTDYGLVILTKMLLFAVMLIIAAINRWRLMPGIERGELGPFDALRRNVLLEQVIGALVLGAAAILGTLPPHG